MKSTVRARFWLEAALASLCGFLAVLTLFWRDWIEALTGFDPDHHNGSFEWLIVAGLFAGLRASSGVAARGEWRRPRPARRSRNLSRGSGIASPSSPRQASEFVMARKRTAAKTTATKQRRLEAAGEEAPGQEEAAAGVGAVREGPVCESEEGDAGSAVNAAVLETLRAVPPAQLKAAVSRCDAEGARASCSACSRATRSRRSLRALPAGFLAPATPPHSSAGAGRRSAGVDPDDDLRERRLSAGDRRILAGRRRSPAGTRSA